MTCNACGEKPKNTAKDFTKAVIEINNPETLVLLRKVVIPASMGAEEQVPPAIGKYHNVILYYEANKHTYLYSSDGIPTLLETDVPQEVLDKIDQLEDGLEQETTMREGMDEELQSSIDAVAQDLEDFKNSPDVADIVATYAALQAYDTSHLGDKDIIRVLTDETHDGASSYYRWDKQTETWTYIGSIQTAANTIFYADLSETGDWGVAIGSGNGSNDRAKARGDGSIAIGHFSDAGAKGSISLGVGSATTSIGQIDVGSSDTSYGYSSSNYRLLTGLYDPQNAHDAATKGYVDSVAPTITMTTTDPGEGAPLAANQFIGVYE